MAQNRKDTGNSHGSGTMTEFNLATLQQTATFGRMLGEAAIAGDVIMLEGGLGSGKTTLTQSIGRGLHLPESMYVTSPTFNLMHEYSGRLVLYHMDLYRISSQDEIVALGFDEYFHGQGVTVVEWPAVLGSLLPRNRLHVFLEISGDFSRIARVHVFDGNWRQRINKLALEFS